MSLRSLQKLRVQLVLPFHHLRTTFTTMATKTVAVIDASELPEGQMKQVAFPPAGEDGQILLTNLGGKIHATSAFCTHYGAPLAKGVLSTDGRVVCPWHGACFNVCSGDIEDAPAPSALHSFKTEVKEGKIFVTANPSYTTKKEMARPPVMSTTDGSANKGVVIVGGGSGAFQTVESLREYGYTDPITILSKEPYVPIDRTKLSKALITDDSKLQWRSAADYKIKLGTNIRVGVTVTSISPSKKTVTLDDGKETIPYDKLVLSPGGIPRRLPIEGVDLENVFSFRDVSDAVKVDAAAKEGKNAVFIGSSFISMELVAAISKRKLASINVIGMEEFPFEMVLGKEVGAGLKKFHESQGVIFNMQAKVKRIVASSEDSKKAEAVEITLPSGESKTLKADFVVMGAGVRPATDFIKDSPDAGITLEKDGGVKVDEYLQVPGKDGIYAIGDIAHYLQIETGEHRRIEHWNVAGNHGRAVGRHIATADSAKPFEKIPIFWSAQGQQLRYCGLGAGFDSTIIKGDPGEMKFVAYYVKGDKVVAVASMQNDPVVSKSSELFRLGKMPSAEEIKNGKDLLTISI